MIKTLTAFFKSWNKDFLDDEDYLENVDLEGGKANPPKEGSRFPKIFVDFADYDHIPSEEDIEKMKAKKKVVLRIHRAMDPFEEEELLDGDIESKDP